MQNWKCYWRFYSGRKFCKPFTMHFNGRLCHLYEFQLLAIVPRLFINIFSNQIIPASRHVFSVSCHRKQNSNWLRNADFTAKFLRRPLVICLHCDGRTIDFWGHNACLFNSIKQTLTLQILLWFSTWIIFNTLTLLAQRNGDASFTLFTRKLSLKAKYGCTWLCYFPRINSPGHQRHPVPRPRRHQIDDVTGIPLVQGLVGGLVRGFLGFPINK